MKTLRILFSFLFVVSIVTGAQAQNKAGKAALENIHQRKSVRTYSDKKIPDNVMTELLRAAMAAPTGMNVQPWHFIVLTDTSQYDRIFAGNFNMRMFKESAAVVILCADTTFMRPTRDNPNGPAVLQINRIWRDDMGACTENFLLACEAYGLGACWTACYPFPDRMNSIKETLNLPPTVVPYSVVPVGYPRLNEKPKDKWKPEKIHYGRW